MNRTGKMFGGWGAVVTESGLVALLIASAIISAVPAFDHYATRAVATFIANFHAA